MDLRSCTQNSFFKVIEHNSGDSKEVMAAAAWGVQE